MNTVKEKTLSTGSSFSTYFKGNNQLEEFETQKSRISLPQKIESFLQHNYGNYNVDQVIVHKNGPQITRYEIGVDSVYEYTIHFNAQGEFNKVDLVE